MDSNINFIGSVYENIRIFKIDPDTYDRMYHRIGRDYFEYLDNIKLFISKEGIVHRESNKDDIRAICYKIILDEYNKLAPSK